MHRTAGARCCWDDESSQQKKRRQVAALHIFPSTPQTCAALSVTPYAHRAVDLRGLFPGRTAHRQSFPRRARSPRSPHCSTASSRESLVAPPPRSRHSARQDGGACNVTIRLTPASSRANNSCTAVKLPLEQRPTKCACTARTAYGMVAVANGQRDPLVPLHGAECFRTGTIAEIDVECGGGVRGHLAERAGWDADVDRLPVAVEHERARERGDIPRKKSVSGLRPAE